MAHIVGRGIDLQPPALIRHANPATARHGRFKTQQKQEGQPRLGPGAVSGGLPSDLQPAACRVIGYKAGNLGLGHPLGRGGAEGDAEELQPRTGGGKAFGQQARHLAQRGVLHRQQFKPVAQRPQRIDKVMADARSDHGCEFRSFALSLLPH